MSTEAVFLIVDDEIMQFLCLPAEEKGLPRRHGNLWAGSRRKLNRERFDVALVDLKLPDSNGLDI